MQKMRGFTFICGAVIALFAHPIIAQVTPSKAVTAQKQSQLTPEEALNLLEQGNQRFLNNQMRNYNYVKDMKVSTKYGQHPIAIILNCIDSRSIAETLFDQGIASIFVSRIAGNVAGQDVLGGMEFATKHAGAKLIVVMGHTNCGAVRAACANPKLNEQNLSDLIKQIQPAVKQVSKTQKLNCDDPKQIDEIAKQNVIDQVNDIYNDSPTIKQLVDEHKVMLVGAMHNIATGKVDFFYKFTPGQQTDKHKT